MAATCEALGQWWMTLLKHAGDAASHTKMQALYL